jgi:large subunit ribosomal protein L35
VLAYGTASSCSAGLKWHALSSVEDPSEGCGSYVRPTDIKESEMPKMKTKSSAKKRFKVTATGRVKVAQAGKRHGMIKRSNKFLRNARGTTTLSAPDEKIAKSFMPYDR